MPQNLISTCRLLLIAGAVLIVATFGCRQGTTYSLTCKEEIADESRNLHKGRRDDSLFPVKKDKRYGFINSYGKLQIKPRFHSVKKFSEGLAAVRDQNGKVGFIDVDGRFVIQARFEDADRFHHNRAGVKVGRKWGFIDNTGKFIAPPIFESVAWFSEERAAVRKDRMWGFIDLDGKIVIAPKFLDVLPFREGLAAYAVRVQDDYKTGFIDRTGRVVISSKNFVPVFVKGFSGGLARVDSRRTDSATFFARDSRKSYSGFINRKGEIAIPLKYDSVADFENCLAPIMSNEKWGLIDNMGRVVIKPEYSNKFRFSEGLAAVKINQKYGYINQKNQVVIPPRYRYANEFEEGLAVVQFQEDGKWRFIARNGEIAIPLEFDEQPSKFIDGLSLIRVKDKLGYIDRSGRFVWGL